jgi:hypothetical protein
VSQKFLRTPSGCRLMLVAFRWSALRSDHRLLSGTLSVSGMISLYIRWSALRSDHRLLSGSPSGCEARRRGPTAVSSQSCFRIPTLSLARALLVFCAGVPKVSLRSTPDFMLSSAPWTSLCHDYAVKSADPAITSHRLSVDPEFCC